MIGFVNGGFYGQLVLHAGQRNGGVYDVRKCIHVSKGLAVDLQRKQRRVDGVACLAEKSSSDTSNVVDGPFEGRFGNWVLTQDDVDGVMLYRKSLLVCAFASIFASVPVFLPSDSLTQSSAALLSDIGFIAAVGSLGIALQSIHIYMRPLHNALKVFYSVGVAGAVLSAALHNFGFVSVVSDDPSVLFAFGWIFVASTGLFFKEVFCFGRAEAFALTVLTPVLCLGHVSHSLPLGAEKGLLSICMGSLLVFALNKFSMPITNDLGDKSVFEYLEQEQMKQQQNTR